MKNILIPTDFSDNAWNAISYALRLLRQEKCKFYFLHTYSPAFYRIDYALGGASYGGIPDVGLDISLAGLENTLKNVREQFPNKNHTFEIVSAFNMLTDKINEFSEKKDIDFIVMGTKGATGAKQIFLGSNTVFVLRKAKVPVLVIPESYVFRPIKNILFPSDFLSIYKKEEVYTIIELARMFGADITIFHVWEVQNLTERQEKHKNLLLKQFKNVAFEQVQVKGKNLPEAILEYIDTNEIDLLAMMNRDHSFFERILIKQNIDQIGFHVQIPFLVVRDTSEVEK